MFSEYNEYSSVDEVKAKTVAGAPVISNGLNNTHGFLWNGTSIGVAPGTLKLSPTYQKYFETPSDSLQKKYEELLAEFGALKTMMIKQADEHRKEMASMLESQTKLLDIVKRSIERQVEEGTGGFASDPIHDAIMTMTHDPHASRYSIVKASQ